MRRALVGLSAPLALLAGCAGSSAPSRHLGGSICPAPAPASPLLSGVRTARVTLPGAPYSVVTSGGHWSFVTLPAAVAVLSNSRFPPRLVRVIRVPAAAGGDRHGLALADAGRLLIAGAGGGAVVIDVARAERGGRAVLGMLRGPVPSGEQGDAGASSVLASRAGRYVFVARERAGGVAVFDLAVAVASRFRRSGLVGVIPVGRGPSSLALDPSGRWLYVTSVAAAPVSARRPVPASSPPGRGMGTLSLIDTALAERRPRRSVLSSVPAGCEPVDVSTSAGGKLAWVATVSDHAVLGFATSRLVRAPGRSLVARVRVAGTPAAVLPFAGGRRLLVAGSSPGGNPPRLVVLDTGLALAGRDAVLGSVPAGSDPSRLVLVPKRHVALVTDYGSADVEAVDLRSVS